MERNQEDQNKATSTMVLLIRSICGPLMNKVKLMMHSPRKNLQLAQNVRLVALIDLLAEQLLPQYCMLQF